VWIERERGVDRESGEDIIRPWPDGLYGRRTWRVQTQTEGNRGLMS
jgi:hypothetical protein